MHNGGLAGRHTLFQVVIAMSMVNVYKMGAVALVLTVVAFASYLFLRKADIAMPSFFYPVSGPRLIMTMDGFRVTRSENGMVSWRMNARSADLYENKEAKLKDITIIYSSPENKEAKILGEAGTMNTSNGNSSLRRVTREVRVVTSDGYLLTTDSLFWKAGERVVWTDDPFKLLGKEIYLEGVGISANVDLQTFLVKNDVKAVLQE
jgi:LPS export ABC transporter protein LptC